MNIFSTTRRTFIIQSAAVAGAAMTPAVVAAKAAEATFIDTNVYLGNWPFRSFPWTSDTDIVAQLRRRNVTQAWAGSFEAIFQRDIARVNARLAATCKDHADLLLAVGAVNPVLPNWKDDLKRCAEVLGMKIIRAHPNYHGYSLDETPFLQLLEAAADAKLAVQVVAQMEDQRTQHPLVQVKPVDFKPLPDAMKQAPAARVMVLNANATMLVTALSGAGNLWLDFAMIEGVGGLEMVAASPLGKRLCFGSFAPVFYWESAQLKMQEAGLEGALHLKIASGNAPSFLEA